MSMHLAKTHKQVVKARGVLLIILSCSLAMLSTLAATAGDTFTADVTPNHKTS